MEQLRHRLTNVSPQGQRRRVDQNTLKRSDLDDFVKCYFGRARPPGEPTSAAPDKKSRGTEIDTARTPQRGVPTNRHDRKPTWIDKDDKGRWRSYDYEELIKRDKHSIPSNVPGFPRHAQSLGASRRRAGPASANLDIFWLKDAVTRVKERPGCPALEESANLPAPAVTQLDSEAGLSNHRRGYRR